ncbi:endonuclease/exonuclease/phosphatase family protein [Mucisphaera sp.]|uniref:endonuclease/exonuclease/phosphatase family protein n=1 Tax=Mucisphaera sp. TaxID=2913024 RepID=UPI003D09951A
MGDFRVTRLGVTIVVFGLLAGFLGLVGGCASIHEAGSEKPVVIRVASFNTSLSRTPEGKMLADFETGHDPAARRTAEILQRLRPDVVLMNEFDWDAEGRGVELFKDLYLGVSQSEQTPIDYPFVYQPDVNTGHLMDVDVNGDGRVALPADAQGFGLFPGHFGFVVLSRYPIVKDEIRRFQTLLWRDMPGALLPDDEETTEPGDYYRGEVLDRLRLSSKNHVDVPVEVVGRRVHVLASHPTPPVFDGPEDRNGRRNHDEIRLWADYLDGADYLIDDAGVAGGLAEGAHFVIVGDLNADPFDGDSIRGAPQQLLEHPRVNGAVRPASRGGVADAEAEGGANLTHGGDPSLDTADFGGPGNLRVDYVLPSTTLGVVRSGVVWPVAGDPLADLVETSDHRAVWVDVVVE